MSDYAVLLRRGHVLATSRIGALIHCERCGAERPVVGKLLNEFTSVFVDFHAAHAACVAVAAEHTEEHADEPTES